MMRSWGIVVMVLAAIFLLSGCVTLTDEYGNVVELQKSSLGTAALAKGSVEVGQEEELHALVKGSIYETGEQVSVFGACLNSQDQPFSGTYATFSAWYPNGTQFIVNQTLPEIQQGYYLYTAPMSNVQGTYLTELTCHVNGTDIIARAFGEWQNPYWVKRIELLNTTIGEDYQAIMNFFNSLNTSLEGVDNNTLRIIQDLQAVNLTVEDVLMYVQSINLTVNDILSMSAGNFTLINTKLDELNVTNEQQISILQAINQTIISEFDGLNATVLYQFSLLNSSMLQEFGILNATIVQSYNDLSTAIVSVNDSTWAQYGNLSNLLGELNISLYSEFDGLNITIMDNYNNVINAITSTNQTQILQYDNLSTFLTNMNYSMMQEFWTTQSMIENVNVTMLQEFANLSAYLSSMNVSFYERFNSIDQFLENMNITLTNTYNLVSELNITTNAGFANLTTLLNNINITIDGRFNSVDGNLSQIYGAINSLSSLNVNNTALIIETINNQTQNLTVQLGDLQNNFTITIGNLQQDINNSFEITWNMIESVNGTVLNVNQSLYEQLIWVAGVANSSVDRNDSLIMQWLYLIYNQTYQEPAQLTWTEFPDERIIYYKTWSINVEVYNENDVQLGWPLVACYINTTNNPPTNSQLMTSMLDNNANPYFTFSEKITVLSGYNWTTWCVYN